MLIAVDFDGTIVEHKYPAIGKEIPFAIDVLKALASDGHKVVLWTVREGKLLDEAVAFCRSRGLEFYSVNCDSPADALFKTGLNTTKLRADIYIDDRNIGGIPPWDEIYEIITQKQLERRAAKKTRGFFRRRLR